MRGRTIARLFAGVIGAISVVGNAATIDVVGVFPGKAVISIDGASPRSVGIGDTVAGFKLVAADGNGATFVVDGRRQTIPMGSYFARAGRNDRMTAVVTSDSRGHFVTDGFVNGSGVRFLVDTGATMVVLSSNDAKRLALSYLQAPVAEAATANGTVRYHIVKLDRVKVGNVELTNVDAGILDGYDGPALLGMSFLSRTEVSRDGANMLLTRRF